MPDIYWNFYSGESIKTEFRGDQIFIFINATRDELGRTKEIESKLKSKVVTIDNMREVFSDLIDIHAELDAYRGINRAALDYMSQQSNSQTKRSEIKYNIRNKILVS